MNFTDLFIRKPVLAIVINLMILALGLRSVGLLPVLQYPRTENAVVTVTTTYYGADPDVVAGFITTPLENAIAQANGIDYMSSSSTVGLSVITVYLRLNYDPDKALTEINTKVSSVLNQLPAQSQRPVLTVKIGQTIDAMYLGFNSDVLARNQITDYLARVVQPRLQAVKGVQTAEILGGQQFALRAWLDPAKLAAYDLTAADVSAALAENDYISGVGTTKGQMVQVSLSASTGLHTRKEFANLIIKQAGGAIVRLKDVAHVVLGADSYDAQVAFDGKRAVYIGIQLAPNANLLDVLASVHKVFPALVAQFPRGLHGAIVYDSSEFVHSAIYDVIRTLVEALVIVNLVVLLFLGALRPMFIASIAIPLSLIGAFAMMLALGFSINLLTLLALVLAIGLVVDDAIIVVENVNRHLEEGQRPLQAAILAGRELGAPIIAMTAVLISVYVPIAFQGGLTGALFTEFAFTLAGAVTISAIVALTLSPMLCSRLLRPHDEAGARGRRFTELVDRAFDAVRRRYRGALHGSLNTLPVTLVFAALVLGGIYFLYNSSKSELAPQEDQGVVLASSTLAPDATLDQRLLYSRQVFHMMKGFPETAHVFQIDAPGQSISGMVLKPWDQRSRTSNQLQPILQKKLDGVAGARIAAFQLPSLPGSQGLPVQFVLTSTQSFDHLNEVAEKFLHRALNSGNFIFLDSTLRIDNPQAVIEINRDKAAELGLKMSDIGNSLAALLGGGYVNYFSLDRRSYEVIPQVQQRFRQNVDQLLNYYIANIKGVPVPLSAIAHIVTRTVPESLDHFQELNSATIQGVAAPGVTQGDALKFLDDLAARTLPQGYSVDYAGMSRQFVQESGGFLLTFSFALLIIFLSLAALFESFRDPFIILVSVPMSLAGALVFIAIGVGGASLNIYTEVGLVTLMGLVSKHAILIVKFANDLQEEGRSKREAIEDAASVRLRPILMTTAAMVLGVVPLIIATGAGAVSRFNIGLVIGSGLLIGTFFTLFVVPAAFMALAPEKMQEPLAEGEGAPA
ncbi:efflux RND transporter permease subunit [Rhodoblastus acidophilus]|uniref:Efflux RND transporter permease subunit n=1 Tax=Candidatus Rhodoblastus alkanivorans TaxID=2954117 RepID=A0ABS9ZA44_9HYPH|nr:efflux RND transporter permease subunit [Candidatus Rhodoblastus alkanivorans]MCI4678707.1 efflux RND transporter permease subunit [Candidatus Rhodoblastus alkanivorans]MCI4683497.1 efflux RND transporter permease subunit [Candidatus Rhodoblastus alkanivorans]MDI4640812.1 efflux RND transporter permease subunit [Rhodoblastus acidophilus]